MKKRWSGKHALGYAAITLLPLLISIGAGWLMGARIDNYVYDTMLRRKAPVSPTPQAVIVAIDDDTLNQLGDVRSLRHILTIGLQAINAAHPRVTAIDVLLPSRGDPNEDRALEAAMHATHNLVLPTDLVNDRWETPALLFRSQAAAIGHVYPDTNSPDGVMRRVSLELASGNQRYWALSVEAFRLWMGAPRIVESPSDIQIGSRLIPAPRRDGERPVRILYTAAPLPRISLVRLHRNPALGAALTGRAVFLGVTSLSAARDRIVTPFQSDAMHYLSGVELLAQIFETLRRGEFLGDMSDLNIVLLCAGIALVASAAFAFLSGWRAYAVAVAVLAAAHTLPFLFIQAHVVVPWFTIMATAWLSISTAATWQHFAVRRQLRTSEADRVRYQQTIQFVTHEMRTPLTAIQGSSELMGRYNLPEEKQKEFAAMINSESKRLARMIQTFLDLERVGSGQMELRNESFTPAEILDPSLARVRPIAERKNIAIHAGQVSAAHLTGDRELMEYAVYNLLTNAVKYSPAGTEIHVSAEQNNGSLHLSVRDQGIGIEERELGHIFKRFYRTRRAEASGERGTGIGLSIVDQIVRVHGGRVDVISEVGRGSCFTLVLPLAARSESAGSTKPDAAKIERQRA